MVKYSVNLMIIVSLALLIVACGSQTAYLQAHPDLDPRFKEAIANKRIVPGMVPEMVEASWGSTNVKEFFKDEKSGDYFECWYYIPATVFKWQRHIVYTIAFKNEAVIGLFSEYLPPMNVNVRVK